MPRSHLGCVCTGKAAPAPVKKQESSSEESSEESSEDEKPIVKAPVTKGKPAPAPKKQESSEEESSEEESSEDEAPAKPAAPAAKGISPCQDIALLVSLVFLVRIDCWLVCHVHVSACTGKAAPAPAKKQESSEEESSEEESSEDEAPAKPAAKPAAKKAAGMHFVHATASIIIS